MNNNDIKPGDLIILLLNWELSKIPNINEYWKNFIQRIKPGSVLMVIETQKDKNIVFYKVLYEQKVGWIYINENNLSKKYIEKYEKPKPQKYDAEILFKKVKKIINKEDPEGLLKMGAPSNEYDTEINNITFLLCYGKENITEIVDDVFNIYFGDESRPTKVTKIADEIDKVIKQLQQNK